jgi:hypothetical protein
MVTNIEYSKKCLEKINGNILLITHQSTPFLTYIPSKTKILMVKNSYFGPYFGDASKTWYENEASQLKLLNFLKD